MPPLETKFRRTKPDVDPLTEQRMQRLWTKSFIVLVIVVLVAAGVFYYKKTSQQPTNILDSLSNESTPTDTPQLTGKYQAVFLDNGQVYFGRLVAGKKGWLRLEQVFYFKQPSVTPANPSKADASLSKMGSELHGPEDFMEINPEHVLFVEDLKESSQVVKAIQDYESKAN